MARVVRVDENIQLVESGRLTLRTDCDIAAFLLSDGKINATRFNRKEKQLRKLREYTTAFIAANPDGALEENTGWTRVRILRTIGLEEIRE